MLSGNFSMIIVKSSDLSQPGEQSSEAITRRGTLYEGTDNYDSDHCSLACASGLHPSTNGYPHVTEQILPVGGQRER